MVWADILVAYPFFEMQDYLTDVLGISITRAASTVSIWTGVSLLLQPYFLIAYHTLLGNSLILVISTSAHALVSSVYMQPPISKHILLNLATLCRELVLFTRQPRANTRSKNAEVRQRQLSSTQGCYSWPSG